LISLLLSLSLFFISIFSFAFSFSFSFLYFSFSFLYFSLFFLCSFSISLPLSLFICLFVSLFLYFLLEQLNLLFLFFNRKGRSLTGSTASVYPERKAWSLLAFLFHHFIMLHRYWHSAFSIIVLAFNLHVHAQCTHAHTAGFDEDGLMRTAMG
jgi:hypothetical protein